MLIILAAFLSTNQSPLENRMVGWLGTRQGGLQAFIEDRRVEGNLA